jgi:hypothetical protein
VVTPKEILVPCLTLPRSPGAGDRLADVGRRLGELDQTWAFEVGNPPASAGWLTADAISPAMVEAWLAEQTRQLRSRPDIAAAYLGRGLEHALVSACVAARLLGPCIPDPTASNILLRVNVVGSVEAVRFRSESCMPATEPGASGWLAERLVQTIGPLLDTVRSLATFRHTGLWGMVADSVAGTAVRLDQRLGHDPERSVLTWRQAQLLLDQMVEAGALIRRRPRLLPPLANSISPQMVRSTCCMYYATPQGREGSAQDRYCSTCPCLTKNCR